MKFLKTSIFYPKTYNDASKNKIIEKRKKYDEYLLKIKDRYDYNLISLYMHTEEFHDCRITKFDFIHNNFGNKVSLWINSDTKKYKLLFEGVKIFKIVEEFSSEDDITLCEIGVFKKLYYICFHFANGCEMQINFKSIIINNSSGCC